MGHGAGKAVIIDRKNMHSHITQQIVNVHGLFKVCTFRNVFQSRDYPLMIGFSAVGNFAIPDYRVAVQLSIRVI